MTLEAIYFIGQTVAAFAIVGSLIFVGLQSRQAGRASELAAFQMSQERFDGVRQLMVSDQELIDLYDKGLRDPALLDEGELVRFRLLLYIMVEAAQAAFLLSENSRSPLAQWATSEALISRTMATPGGRAWWKLHQHSVHPSFARHLAAILAEQSIGQVLTRQDWIDALNALAPDHPQTHVPTGSAPAPGHAK